MIGPIEGWPPSLDLRMWISGLVSGQSVLDDQGFGRLVIVDQRTGADVPAVENEEIGGPDSLILGISTVEEETSTIQSAMAAAGGTIGNQPGVVDSLPEEVQCVGFGLDLDSGVEVASFEIEKQLNDVDGIRSKQPGASHTVGGDQFRIPVILQDGSNRFGRDEDLRRLLEIDLEFLRRIWTA